MRLKAIETVIALPSANAHVPTTNNGSVLRKAKNGNYIVQLACFSSYPSINANFLRA